MEKDHVKLEEELLTTEKDPKLDMSRTVIPASGLTPAHRIRSRTGLIISGGLEALFGLILSSLGAAGKVLSLFICFSSSHFHISIHLHLYSLPGLFPYLHTYVSHFQEIMYKFVSDSYLKFHYVQDQ